MARIQQIQSRRGAASAWTSANSVLAAGEIGFETDTARIKIGDGSTSWSSLSYYGLDTTGHSAESAAGLGGRRESLQRRTGAIAETFPLLGSFPTNQASALASGQLQFTAIPLLKGELISNLTLLSGSVALAGGTHKWAGLWTPALVNAAISLDDTAAANWAALTEFTFAMTSAYLVPSDGLYQVGVMVAATTVPGLICLNGNATVNGLAPIKAARDSTHTGLTTPSTAPAPPTFTASANQFYAWAS